MFPTQKIIKILIILALLIGAYWYITKTGTDENSADVADLPNPAAVYCLEELGGTPGVQETSDGQVGVCGLPDGRECEEWELYRTGKCMTPWIVLEPTDTTASPGELAEQAGLNFILDFALLPAVDSDSAVAERFYQRLSTNAKESVSLETLSQDALQFVDVKSYPEQGASVVDMQIESDTRATIIVELNYSDSPRILRAVELVVEDSVWKVERVYALDPEYDKGG